MARVWGSVFRVYLSPLTIYPLPFTLQDGGSSFRLQAPGCRLLALKSSLWGCEGLGCRVQDLGFQGFKIYSPRFGAQGLGRRGHRAQGLGSVLTELGESLANREMCDTGGRILFLFYFVASIMRILLSIVLPPHLCRFFDFDQKNHGPNTQTLKP